MNEKWKKILLKYGITALVGGLMSYAVIDLHGYSMAQTPAEKYLILADAFTIPGVILMLCAVLVWIANQETFTGLTYAGKRMVRALLPFARKNEPHETYYDYLDRKRKEGKVKGYGFLFYVGAVFFAVALVFIYLFYTAS